MSLGPVLCFVRVVQNRRSLGLDGTFTDLGSSACPQQQQTTTRTPPSATRKTEEEEEEGGGSVRQAPPTRVCNWSILGTVRNGPIKSSIVVLCVQAHYFLMMRDAASIQSFDWKITVTSVTFTELFLCQVILLHIFYSF